MRQLLKFYQIGTLKFQARCSKCCKKSVSTDLHKWLFDVLWGMLPDNILDLDKPWHWGWCSVPYKTETSLLQKYCVGIPCVEWKTPIGLQFPRKETFLLDPAASQVKLQLLKAKLHTKRWKLCWTISSLHVEAFLLPNCCLYFVQGTRCQWQCHKIASSLTSNTPIAVSKPKQVKSSSCKSWALVIKLSAQGHSDPSIQISTGLEFVSPIKTHLKQIVFNFAIVCFWTTCHLQGTARPHRQDPQF